MKRIFSILCSIIVLITACDNNKSKGKEDKSNPDSTVILTDLKKKGAEANDKLVEELQKLTPLTEEKLTALMPGTIMDAALSDYSFSSTLGAPVGNGNYRISDSSSVMLTISDCAGPGGAGLYNLQFAGQLDYNTDNENEYSKVIDFNGGKAIEFCKKASDNCSLTWFSGGRFLVMLEGNNVNAGELKDIAKGLKIK